MHLQGSAELYLERADEQESWFIYVLPGHLPSTPEEEHLACLAYLAHMPNLNFLEQADYSSIKDALC